MNTAPSPLRILLVDDSRALRYTMRTVLKTFSDLRVVGKTENGKLAIQMARYLSPDLVLMDIEMPVMDGAEATRQILAENSNLKVIGYSAAAQPSQLRKIMDAGAVAFLNKSVSADQLVQGIRNATVGVQAP